MRQGHLSTSFSIKPTFPCELREAKSSLSSYTDRSGICFFAKTHVEEGDRKYWWEWACTHSKRSVVQYKEQLNLMRDETDQGGEGVVGRPFLSLNQHCGIPTA